MMVMYVPVKFEFDWTNRFRVRVRKKNVDGQMDGQKNGAKTNKRTEKWTNEQTELHQFRKEPMMVIYVPVKDEFDWSNRFGVRVRKQKCGQTDGWTDKRTKNGQTNGQNFTNIERNLAMMLIYVPVRFEFDRTNRF